MNDNAKKGIAAAIAAVGIAIYLWPTDEGKPETKQTSSEHIGEHFVGSWIYNPGMCDGELVINKLMSYAVSEKGLVVNQRQIQGQWEPVSLSDKRISKKITNAIASCNAKQSQVSDIYSVKLESPDNEYALFALPPTSLMALSINEGDLILLHKFDLEYFASLPVNHAGNEDYDPLAPKEPDWAAQPYPYDVRSDIEYYDDPGFYEQFKEAEQIIEENKRAKKLIGEAQLDSETGL